MTTRFKSEVVTEYRLEWDYPFLANRGKTEWSEPGLSKNAVRGRLTDTDEAYCWGGREIRWQTRQKRVSVTEWEDETKEEE